MRDLIDVGFACDMVSPLTRLDGAAESKDELRENVQSFLGAMRTIRMTYEEQKVQTPYHTRSAAEVGRASERVRCRVSRWMTCSMHCSRV